jgi:hypothetical protein
LLQVLAEKFYCAMLPEAALIAGVSGGRDEETGPLYLAKAASLGDLRPPEAGKLRYEEILGVRLGMDFAIAKR